MARVLGAMPFAAAPPGALPAPATNILGCRAGRARSAALPRSASPIVRPPAGRALSRLEPCAALAGARTDDPIASERSPLVNREVVLFLFQREMDAQLQRALTYEDFELAKAVRARREQVDRALAELQEGKGRGCGASQASSSTQLSFAPRALTLRAHLAQAISGERYAEAAALRDELAALEAQAAAAELPRPPREPRFRLGEMVVHSGKGYRGVVAGWDLACCEDEGWRAAAGVDALQHGAEQVFYHVLVDSADWPPTADQPPVAYVAEELLGAASMADFASAEPLVDSAFDHPYAYLMFLGSDGHGNMIPCAQLRDKYCVQRRDVFPPGEGPGDDDDDGAVSGRDGGGGSSGGGADGGGGGAWGGGSRIPGIDMKSLD